MNKRDGSEVTSDMAAAFAKTVLDMLRALNGGKVMTPQDFARLVPLAGRKVQEELPRIYAAYRAARREVQAGKAPPPLTEAIVLGEAAGVAFQVWSEYQKQSRRELANN